jgi:hypothetical protein
MPQTRGKVQYNLIINHLLSQTRFEVIILSGVATCSLIGTNVMEDFAASEMLASTQINNGTSQKTLTSKHCTIMINQVNRTEQLQSVTLVRKKGCLWLGIMWQVRGFVDQDSFHSNKTMGYYTFTPFKHLQYRKARVNCVQPIDNNTYEQQV